MTNPLLEKFLQIVDPNTEDTIKHLLETLGKMKASSPPVGCSDDELMHWYIDVLRKKAATMDRECSIRVSELDTADLMYQKKCAEIPTRTEDDEKSKQRLGEAIELGRELMQQQKDEIIIMNRMVGLIESRFIIPN